MTISAETGRQVSINTTYTNDASQPVVSPSPAATSLSTTAAPEPPAWSLLEHQKCSHCPLKEDAYRHCPIAKNLGTVADDFKSERSFEKLTVEVLAPERTYQKKLALQEGLFGLFGLIMATSDCPFFEFLRPMARFHLPFSTLKETTVRSVSMYLLRQYFVAKAGGVPDFELKAFGGLYKDLEIVNLGIINRIRSISKADAEANSVIILDGFAKLLSAQHAKNFSDLDQLFNSKT